MRSNRQPWTMIFREADGSGAGGASGGDGASAGGERASDTGGAGSATPDLVKAAAENKPANGQNSAQGGGSDPAGAAAAYWPEGLPETLSGLKGANDRETIDKLAGHLKDAPRAPEKPDGYKLALPEEFTKRFGDLSGDEVLPIWRQVAHKNGLTDQQFNGAISELYAELSDKGLIDEPIDVMAKLEKLAPKHGDPVTRKAQASARINGVASSVDGLVNRGIFSKTEGNMLLSLAARADGVVVLEKLFKAASEHGRQGGGQDAGGGKAQTQHERAMRSMFPTMSK